MGGAGDTPEHRRVPKGGIRGGGHHTSAVSVRRRHVQGLLCAG